MTGLWMGHGCLVPKCPPVRYMHALLGAISETCHGNVNQVSACPSFKLWVTGEFMCGSGITYFSSSSVTFPPKVTFWVAVYPQATKRKEKRRGKKDKIQTISGTNYSFHSPVTQSENNSQSNYATTLNYHSGIWGNATFCTGSFGSCPAEPSRQQRVRSEHSSAFIFIGEQEFPEPRRDVWREEERKPPSDVKVPFNSGWS